MRVLLMVVLALTATGCAASLAPPGRSPQPFPRPSAEPARSPGEAGAPDAPLRPGLRPDADEDVSTAGGYEISGTALTFRGVPYRDGGADPKGFDCSGFVWYVFGTHGVPLPRTVAEQARWGERVNAAELRPGDLVFFSTVAPGPTHVGIVIGGDSFVHAPSSTGVVRVERLSASYWSARFVEARRVI